MEGDNWHVSGLTVGQVAERMNWERLAEHLRHVASRRIDELFAILDELSPA
jgi:hypothetical protein